MELIKDKIAENVERRKILLELCEKIKEQDDVQNKLAREEEVIAEDICKGLISKKVVTTIKVSDVNPENSRDEEKIALNNLGIGYQPKYGTNMNTYSRNQLLRVLMHGRLLVPFVKRKSATTRLELFEDVLKGFKVIEDHDVTVSVKQRDYDTSNEDNDVEDDKGSFSMNSPYKISGDGYHSLNIEYLSQYVMIEEHYDKLKLAYEEALQEMVDNNKVLKSILDDTKEKLGPWLLIKEL